LRLTLPGMWADHHVLAVNAALSGVDGVAETSASALHRTLDVRFDPAATGADAIAAALAAAGYAPAELVADPAPPSNKPAWATAGSRVTATDPRDQTMSGDHRRY
jgi:copper chaperone CopZ